MYRDKIARLTRERADLEKTAAREAEKLARLESDVGRLSRSVTTRTSSGTAASHGRQIEGKRKQAAQVQKKLADLQTRIGRKVTDLAAAQKNLDRATKQRAVKEESEAKKQQREELRHARELTRETGRRAALFATTVSLEAVRTLPPAITVLVLAANPVDQAQLRLDEEVRAIRLKIRESKHRDSVKLASEWALRTGDLLQYLNEYQPHVVHFSGHGSDREELAFHAEDGGTKRVSKEAIAAVIATAADNTRLIVFNACYSRGQAEAVTRHVEAAIGMSTAIGDDAARVFAAQFYSAIGFGMSVKRAFEQARAQLLLEGILEADTPELFVRDGVDADAIVLVRPEGVEPSEPETRVLSAEGKSDVSSQQSRVVRVGDLVAELYAWAKNLQDEMDSGVPPDQQRVTSTSLSAQQAKLRTALVGLEHELPTARQLGSMDHSRAGLGQILRGWLGAQDEVHRLLADPEKSDS